MGTQIFFAGGVERQSWDTTDFLLITGSGFSGMSAVLPNLEGDFPYLSGESRLWNSLPHLVATKMTCITGMHHGYAGPRHYFDTVSLLLQLVVGHIGSTQHSQRSHLFWSSAGGKRDHQATSDKDPSKILRVKIWLLQLGKEPTRY